MHAGQHLQTLLSCDVPLNRELSRHPKPAVAGAFVGGPLAGAGFSVGPDSGGTIFPAGYGHTVVAGTHTVTLVGKSNPVATATGVAG